MTMVFKVLFLMDPYETLNLATETSLLLMEEFIARGHQVYWLEQENLWLRQDEPVGLISRVQTLTPFVKDRPVELSLNRFDALLPRLDPPVDQNYLNLTYLLDFLNPTVLQFNPIRALRNFNEKLLPLRWPEWVPPTLVSRNKEQLLAFLKEQQEIIIKPLNDCSGRGVIKLHSGQTDAEQLLASSLLDKQDQPQFLQAQKFLAAVAEGDKRVYLVNGAVAGIVNRLPKAGSFLANIHQGASCEASELTDREAQIIETIKPFLLAQGLCLVGVDFIGGYLTELNITSPSAIRQINQVSQATVHKQIVDALIEALNKPERMYVKCAGFLMDLDS